ncbi:helix-turn-helix domain-containing protein [Salipiger aestuarii]|uniref:helix-turn-helix domain-containing protein n=1 Tax=Salipiger aestuarii TaxID=568098 RepID=UPI000DB9C610
MRAYWLSGTRWSPIAPKKGRSQRDLARETGLRQSFIAKMEKGSRRIDAVELVVISRLLDVPASDLLNVVAVATPQDHKILGDDERLPASFHASRRPYTNEHCAVAAVARNAERDVDRVRRLHAMTDSTVPSC